MQRMDISQVAPDLYKALLGVETYLRGSVEPATYELVKLRASITNGCLFCVDMHTNDAMKAGETTQRLFGLAAWREAPWYTDAERAALALTDAATTLGPDGVPDDVWHEAAEHFDEKALADLVGAIAMINLWNRVAVPTRSTPLSAR
ncbi:MAG TPA: carboxymuconolactone decarboxylase family protein [Acidimicrobiales bacterium]